MMEKTHSINVDVNGVLKENGEIAENYPLKKV